MMKKKMPRDPEQEARWAEARRQLQARIDHNNRLIREGREREERRRARLRRLTFGLLPRY
jgi:hypothetical protein